MHFPSKIFFNDINHSYRAVILKKNSLWLLPFYIVLASYFYYEMARRTMRTAVVSNLLKAGAQKKILRTPGFENSLGRLNQYSSPVMI